MSDWRLRHPLSRRSPFPEFVDGNLLHSGRLKNDGRGMLVKASYLFCF
jgi:hypothetical protein